MSLIFCNNLCGRSRIIYPILYQLRWKRKKNPPTKTTRYRKPMWMPTAKSKVFRIPQHPYVSPEEEKLTLSLVDEYFRKIESLRVLFRNELAKKSDTSAIAVEQARIEEEEHKRFLEENRLENERIKKIREETLDKEFHEYALQLLEQYEKDQKEENLKRLEIEKIVLAEKEKSKSYITIENLEEKIEQAIDNPININFCIDTKGNIIWEDEPPKDYENYVYSNVHPKTRRSV